jgi:hypothetical protein
MVRPALKHREVLFLGVAISIGAAACSSDVPRARTDSGSDTVRDSRVDLVDAGRDTTSDIVDGVLDRGSDRGDVASDVADQSSDLSDTSGTGGTVGSGGTSGTGGTNGTGGGDAGHDTMDSPPDSDEDTPDGPSDQPKNNDGGADADATPGVDDAADAPPACGPGCPSTVAVGHLALWLAADFGVTCSAQGRVTSWADRGDAHLPVVPVATKTGPRCGADTITSKSALFFDRLGTDDSDGVLMVNLDQVLARHDYTVFVVERRQSNTEGYILGTNPLSTSCDTNADVEYRFGYDTLYDTPGFVAGPYAVDQDGNCLDPAAAFTPYSPSDPAALEIEVFNQTIGHSLYVNGVLAGSNTDMNPIQALSSPAFIGRAFPALSMGTRTSRYLGDLAEIVIYSVALNDIDRAAVTTYLAGRWQP